MKIIFSEGRDGATINLIYKAHNTNLLLVSCNRYAALALKMYANIYKYNILKPTHFYKIIHNYEIPKNDGLLIDDYDPILKPYLKNYIINTVVIKKSLSNSLKLKKFIEHGV